MKGVCLHTCMSKLFNFYINEIQLNGVGKSRKLGYLKFLSASFLAKLLGYIYLMFGMHKRVSNYVVTPYSVGMFRHIKI